MDIRITGRSGDVTAAMKAKATKKVEKLTRFYERITWVDVVLDVDHERHRVDMTAGLNRGATVVGKSEANDMYAAIDLAVDKVGRQLRKHKEKLNDRRTRRGAEPEPPVPGSPDSDSTEETDAAQDGEEI